VALSIAAEHARRFPRGQLASERALIRSRRCIGWVEMADGARWRAGCSWRELGLYAERVHQLLEKSPSHEFFCEGCRARAGHTGTRTLEGQPFGHGG